MNSEDNPTTAGGEKERWPDRLPGLDIEDGVVRMGGDRKLYGDMLREYCTTFSGFSSRMRRLIADGDFPTARREAHTLKGAAGTVAAAELYAASLELEHACRDGDEQLALSLLPRMESEMDQVVRSAEKVEALTVASDKKRTGVDPEPKKGHDADELVALFESLKHGIAACDPVATGQVVERIEAGALPKSIEVSMGLLKNRIDNYDFDGAAKTLGLMVKKLGK